MAQSLSSVLVHLVFSTKDREPFISADVEAELHAYLVGIFKECKCPSRPEDCKSIWETVCAITERSQLCSGISSVRACQIICGDTSTC